MKIDDEQVIETEKKKRGSKAVKSIKNTDKGTVANKVNNTNVRAKVKTKTGIRDEKEIEYKNSSKDDDDEFETNNFKRNLILFLVFMIIGFVVYYFISAGSYNNSSSLTEVENATVSISTFDKKNNLLRHGSGFVYKKDDYSGYIVTSYNTVKLGDKFKVNFSGSDIDSTLLGGDKYLNVAVLSVDKKYVKNVVKFGNSDKVKNENSLSIVGRPESNNRNILVTDGVLLDRDLVDIKVDAQNYAVDAFKTDASVSKGDSGAPLCDKKGLVVGMVVSKVSGRNLTYAKPINDFKENLYMFEKGNHLNWPYIGITVFNVEDTNLINKYGLSSKIDYDSDQGVVIASVKGSSKAYGVLNRGDVITKINKVNINNVAKLRYELFKYSIDDTINVTINRNGEKKVVSVTLKKAE